MGRVCKSMHFPLPLRITAPLLALVFGLAVTWFDYRLNLDLDLSRHLGEVRGRAELNGLRLARNCERLLAAKSEAELRTQVEAMADLPGLEDAAVVDTDGRIIADTTGALVGLRAVDTPLREAAALIATGGRAVVRHDENEQFVVSAHPFRIGENGTGWALLEFFRSGAIAAAEDDAQTQLRWMASAMTILSFGLWAILHFGFAARLARLTGNVRALGEGKADAPALPTGGDEVGTLASAFAAMSAQLHARELEQVRLEREVLEISERERRNVGHDLHDGLGQRLTAVSMTTNALVAALKTDAPTLAERGEDIGRQLRDAIAEARSLSHGLAPVALVDDGLMVALSTLAVSTERSGTRCVFECPSPVRVNDAEISGHLYRIAQEAVNNALKHAVASEIRIAIERSDAALTLEIDDDGDGIDETKPTSDGIGLRVMRYRAQLIGGALEIGSAPAGGTRIVCRITLSK
jgi:signal transduction histidine kinase